jgi:drug/metabolite transporter (DMT)-like permease
VIPVQCLIDIGFTLSFVYSSAAIALLLINLNPLWGAIIGRIFLKGVLPMRTYVALVLALGCMIIIFLPKMLFEEQDDETITPKGNIFSLFTGLLLATYLSIVRNAARHHISLVGGTPLGAFFSMMVSVIVTKGKVLPGLFWEVEMWKFGLAVIAQGFGMGMIFITEVSGGWYRCQLESESFFIDSLRTRAGNSTTVYNSP